MGWPAERPYHRDQPAAQFGKHPGEPTPEPGTNVSTAATNAPATPAPEIPVKLAALVLSNASFHFSDLSLQLHCNFEVKAFNGTIVGLSSERETTAAVELGGNVDERAPFSIA